MNMTNTNKVSIIPVSWRHHLEGAGWEWVCSHVIDRFHDSKKDIKTYMAYEYQVREKVFKPHIAWFHQVLSGPERCLKNLVHSDFWENNMKYLVHAITVSKYQEDFLRKHGINNISTLTHPTPINVHTWDIDKFMESKNIYHVGFYCRNANHYKKIIKQYHGELKFNYLTPKQKLKVLMPQQIKVIPRVKPKLYEEILTSSIVFMNLTDATANNTILECIARGTPVIVNPVGGIKEYLGENYPLYYNSDKEAICLLKTIKNRRLLKNTSKYLINMRQKYSIDKFLDKLDKILSKIDYEIYS